MWMGRSELDMYYFMLGTDLRGLRIYGCQVSQFCRYNILFLVIIRDKFRYNGLLINKYFHKYERIESYYN